MTEPVQHTGPASVHGPALLVLVAVVAAMASPPESLEVGWFSEGEVRALDNWNPAANIDIGVQIDIHHAHFR